MGSIELFLSTAIPWQNGYVNIHYPFKANGKPLMPGRAFTSLDDACRYVFSCRQNRDLYVCMSLQSQSKGGGQARRSANNALLLRSWWLDVDIKNGFFRDTQHALEAFGEWRTTLGLPKVTFIVLSGSGGFHAHWVSPVAVSRETWQPLANALAIAARSFKPLPGPNGEERQLDLGLTTDPARLLRIPDTFNFKHNPPAPVTLAYAGDICPVEQFNQALVPFMGIPYLPGIKAIKNQKRIEAASAFKGMPEPPPLDAGLPEPPTPTIEQVADACPWIARVLATGGEGCAEPEWFESLKVGFFCKDNEAVAHRLSDKHASYTEQETDQKLAQISETHGGKGYGWPQCTTIHGQGAVECKGCRHLPHGKSPINFVTEPAPVAPVVSHMGNPVSLPSGYSQDGGYIYVKVKVDGEQKQELVTNYPMFNFRTEAKNDDGSGDWSIGFDTYLDNTRPQSIILPYEFTERRMMESHLRKQGMIFSERSGKRVREFLASFVEQLRARKMSSSRSEPFGWSVENGKRTGFVYGGERFNCAGITPVTVMDTEVAMAYRPSGSLDCFKKNAALLIQQERYDLITIIASGFGGVLVPLTGIDGVVMAAYSQKGGLGKSHAMRIAQSVWARPVKSMSSVSDTANFVTKKMGILRNLPFFFDEIKLEADMETVVGLIFASTQGKTKGRLTATTESREIFEFSTLLAIASNNSLVDYVNEHVKTTTAGLNRIYEFQVQPNTTGIGLILPSEAQQLYGELRDNYGHPGAIYSAFLGKNIEPVERAVKKMCNDLNTMVGGTTDERFWISTMAVCYIGAHLSNKLGLTEINKPKLLDFLLNTFYQLRGTTAESVVDITKGSSVVRFFQDYVSARMRTLLITNRVPQGPGRPTTQITIRHTNPDYRDGVRARYAYEDKLLRISLSDFRAWLKRDRRVGPHEIVMAAKMTLGARVFKTNLTSGTSLASVREDVMEIDTTNYPGIINIE